MSSVDRIELYEYVLNLSKVEDLYQGCMYDIDILKDYGECNIKSKELSSCDLFSYKTYVPAKKEWSQEKREYEKIDEGKIDKLKEKIPKSLQPFTSDVKWNIPSYCTKPGLKSKLSKDMSWIYESFPNIYVLMNMLMIFNYKLEDGNSLVIDSGDIGSKIITDGQRESQVIEIFNVIMNEAVVLKEYNAIEKFYSKIWIMDSKTKYYKYEGDEIREETKIKQNFEDVEDYNLIMSKVFSKTANIIVISDLKGNISTLMRILFRLYLTKILGQNLKILINNVFLIFTGDWFGDIKSVGGYIVYRLLIRLMYENEGQVIITKCKEKFVENEIQGRLEEFNIDMGVFQNTEINSGEEEDDEEQESKYIKKMCLLNNLFPRSLLVKKDGDNEWICIGDKLEFPIKNLSSSIKNIVYIGGGENVDIHDKIRYYITYSDELDPKKIQNNNIIFNKVQNIPNDDSRRQTYDGPMSHYGGGSNNDVTNSISKFTNLKTLHRCGKNICSGHTYEIRLPEQKPRKFTYLGMEISTFMQKKDSFICLRLKVDVSDTSFIHIIPNVIDIDEKNYLQKMRNGKIYIEKQLLKLYVKEIREIIKSNIPRNRIYDILKRNGYNPNRALVELANYRLSHNHIDDRLPTDKFMMIEPLAVKIKEDNKMGVSYSKFDRSLSSNTDLQIRELSLVLFHVKRANSVKKTDVIALREPKMHKTKDNERNEGIFLFEKGDDLNKEEYRYVHGIYRTEKTEYHGLFNYEGEEKYKFLTGIEFTAPKSDFIEESLDNKYRIQKMYYFGSVLSVVDKKVINPDDIDNLVLENIKLSYNSSNNKEVKFEITDAITRRRT